MVVDLLIFEFGVKGSPCALIWGVNCSLWVVLSLLYRDGLRSRLPKKVHEPDSYLHQDGWPLSDVSIFRASIAKLHFPSFRYITDILAIFSLVSVISSKRVERDCALNSQEAP
jgi:hypothetical protein